MEPTEVVNALMTGRYDEISDAADAHFRRSIPTSEIKRVWEATTARFGGQPVGIKADVVLHDLGLSFANGEAHVQIAYRDGKIAGLVLRPGPPTGRFGE
ncbi:MAG: hypothetical protein JO152_02095 [Mycobacteriaceae bacterium]|nr:hypothetical protein [Mycobacteriaceae bacterium]MBV9096540.1 hypothetical protein [Frankiaceae bacterium]